MLTKTKFIVIEGIDGSGKTTVIEEILKPLLTNRAVYTRDPGGTVFADKIRSILVNHVVDEEIHPLTEALLFYASRTQMVTHIINPALNSNKTVVCDRFSWSTWAYQYAGIGLLTASTFQQLDAMVPQTLLEPLVIYLDISPEMAMARIKQAEKQSKFDLRQQDFFTKVRNKYLDLVKQTPQCYLINAAMSIELIKQQITRIIEGL